MTTLGPFALNLVHLSDCVAAMQKLPDNCIDSIVTDPPYGLEFMGKEWDKLDVRQPGDANYTKGPGPFGRAKVRYSAAPSYGNWQAGGGFSKPGIGDRKTEWPSFSATNRFGAANPTCAKCGGRLRGAKKCACPEPDWKPIGKRRDPENEGLPDDVTGTGMRQHLSAMQEWHYLWAVEALRVAKPGAHLLAFGGTRTYHRLACAIEDAGWEIRDCVMWVYGQGFPKSLDVGKAIDKVNGEPDRLLKFTRWMRTTGLSIQRLNAVTGTNMGTHYLTTASQPAIPTAELWAKIRPLIPNVPDWVDALVARIEAERGVVGQQEVPAGHAFAGKTYGGDSASQVVPITVPATDAAKQWDGWGTSLKPAWEPCIVARKPLEGTVAANVLKYGTGAVNIDACRVPVDDSSYARNCSGDRGHDGTRTPEQEGRTNLHAGGGSSSSLGRFPANVIHDGSPEVTELFPTDVGGGKATRGASSRIYGGGKGFTVATGEEVGIGDGPGSAARFFYCAKANAERSSINIHPTLKPLELMKYLCKLVTPPNGIVLDPFTGSGSTGAAALECGFKFLGFEKDEKYYAIAKQRIILRS